MSANSVAINALFIFTISCSIFHLSISGLIDNTIILDNTSQSPIETINNTITNMAATIAGKLAQIQTVNSSRMMEQIKQNSELIEDYKDALTKNINLLEIILRINTSLTNVQSHILELEEKSHNNVTKENNILVFELSLETLRLAAKLYQDQENKSNFTEAYDKLNDKYKKWKNSLNDSRLSNEEINNILLQLYDTLKKLSFAQNQIIDASTEINKKYNKSSESLSICEKIVQRLNKKVELEEELSDNPVYLKAIIILLKYDIKELQNEKKILEVNLENAKKNFIENNITLSNSLASKSAELNICLQHHSTTTEKNPASISSIHFNNVVQSDGKQFNITSSVEHYRQK